MKDQILNFIKQRGPSQPTEISRHIGKDQLITSAFLSDLTSSNLLKISHIKSGSSPFYYLPGQEVQISNVGSKYLKSYELQAFNLIKDKY